MRTERENFARFAASSLTCTALDQSLAALLFAQLKGPFADERFLQILISNTIARVASLTLNYALNHRLVFTPDSEGTGQRVSRRRSLPRFLAVAILILALSTLGVFCASTFLGVAEWQAKIVCDLMLFFLNYHLQHSWVFSTEPTIRRRRGRSMATRTVAQPRALSEHQDTQVFQQYARPNEYQDHATRNL